MTYGRIKTEQKKIGKNIGPNDLLIAAQAMELEATLVTANVKEFKQIKGLKIENWLDAT
jgi:tRNA(fMet)-specific endonuclease VapC